MTYTIEAKKITYSITIKETRLVTIEKQITCQAADDGEINLAVNNASAGMWARVQDTDLQAIITIREEIK